MDSTEGRLKQRAESCGPRFTKRRTKAEVSLLRQRIVNVAATYQPLTLRQLFYRLVVRKHIQKTEAGYKAVGRLTGQLRESGDLPWSWIVDSSRMVRQRASYSGLGEFLEQTQRLYRRNLWQDQPEYVEIWCESESAAGVLCAITYEWGVPLRPFKGYGSRTFLYEVARTLREQNKPATCYYFGDRDPSGNDIDRSALESVRRYGSGEFRFVRVAVTEKQVSDWSLPGAPPKRTDSRAKNFRGPCVELEAIEPDRLRDLCRDCIEQHIDSHALEQHKRNEKAERETLNRMRESLPG
ncbi:hypothetical protein Pla111_01630 [Botrimarina hoheduenensis]|uniref:DUF2399 domain-containing protein n=1 Tax=Botrimarina hoheduenensis TaxID=2528000 RepID=A0A5C5WD29_9BACT|nr:hypothetical protein Pla111_01630 [Botrimarina hoheduenensis]